MARQIIRTEKISAAEDAIADALGVPRRERMLAEKRASIAEYSILFDKIDSGEFGPHVKEALFGVCEGLSSSLQSHHAKVASSPMQMTESQARQARLDQLLRKF
jgi:hypothetical protein